MKQYFIIIILLLSFGCASKPKIFIPDSVIKTFDQEGVDAVDLINDSIDGDEDSFRNFIHYTSIFYGNNHYAYSSITYKIATKLDDEKFMSLIKNINHQEKQNLFYLLDNGFNMQDNSTKKDFENKLPNTYKFTTPYQD